MYDNTTETTYLVAVTVRPSTHLTCCITGDWTVLNSSKVVSRSVTDSLYVEHAKHSLQYIVLRSKWNIMQ